MLVLEKNGVKLGASVTNKADAIEQVGTLLVNTGHMKPGYVHSMMAREKVANTYLGNGIAIPHGLPQDRELIESTGIAVLQVPNGVEWNPGETVHLVIGIAAKSDEHLDILANLTQVLGDEEAVQQLAHTTEPIEIVQRLTNGTQTRSQNGHASPAADAESELDFDRATRVTLPGKLGLHARPASVLVDLAKQFQSEVGIRYRGQTGNAKSLVSLLKLGVAGGETIQIFAKGSDADRAVAELQQAIESGLEDEAESDSAAAPVRLSQSFTFSTPPIPGIAASPGIVIAPVYQLRRGKLEFAETATDRNAEMHRLQQAIVTAKLQLQDLYESVKEKAGAAKAAIFLAQQQLLEDPELQDAAIENLGNDRSAAWAWQQAYEQKAKGIEQLADARIAGRAADLRDVGQRVLRLLAHRVEEVPQMPNQPVILVAEDLTPSDTVSLNPALTLGFCTAYGGTTSHSAIIARSLDIPAIVGVGPSVLEVANGTQCILDGESGNLYPNPSEADLATAQAAQRDLQAQREAERLNCYQPALMKDGLRVEVVANIGAPQEAERAVNAGAEGIGLLRTEFLFLNRSEPPTEEEQFAAYSQMTQALNGLPLIVRTLDIGGDKAIPYLNLPEEENPFLGVRGIRLCLQRPDLFRTQLRAIFRASQTGSIKIMFPMIAMLEEFLQARDIAESVRSEIGADPVDYGMMIEVPSAVLMAAEFAKEVAFFSIGTNDLTQYTLAMDRGHPALAKQADALHPAVLRLIEQTVRAAQIEGKWVGVCGGIAGEPLGAAILTGMGVTELSVSIPSVAAVKAKLRSLAFSQAQDLARRALRCRTAQEVRALR
ncbi:phosphoenolpyruvate--protein phosphotransferase [Leptolyngbya sp. FACHB-711]|uniref:phosphoenolpyruvate--protein phosphotransferase n=1 Tax=unclassified Leptolyngbya TaxID=2650499 RepID=UPI0016859AC3|nr:phosphoenolpyruvate--protein phosphotransferase [Leptolyngbya sp. FACHB-711]MBD1849295.1 phosphoenolpyruvate--protein phosphotransferase [Cyanobacteria bacterium FACHB-502]MBD2027278.1 phosphoenolpyruvate--protein phosphotransferase [Leptolyngbya sp. FACHB-711]